MKPIPDTREFLDLNGLSPP